MGPKASALRVACAALLLSTIAATCLAAAGDEATYSFAGTVVDPQGKPVAGAKVWFDYPLARPSAQPAPADAVSDAAGKFQFSRAKSSLSDWLESSDATTGELVATKAGFGFAARPAFRFETTGRLAANRLKGVRRGVVRTMRDGGQTDRVLKLVPDDVPLQGQITNADGDPVAGATVDVLVVWAGVNGSLDGWEAGVKKEPVWQKIWLLFNRYSGPGGMTFNGRRRSFGTLNQLWEMRALPVAAVKSDSAGHFVLKGIGRERLVELLIRAPGSATVHKFARTRAGEAIAMRNPFGFNAGEIAPGKFTYELEPSVPIEGRVVEAGTVHPLAGFEVMATTALGVRTVSDAQGHYRLDGVPVGDAMLEVVPPNGTRYMPVNVNVWATRGPTALRRDIAVPAGVLVHGRAIDERTGKPIQGSLTYFAWQSNPQSQRARELSFRNGLRGLQTDADGRFAIPVLSGPGILAFRGGSQFHFGVGAEKIDCPTFDMGVGARTGKVFRTLPSLCQADDFNLLVPLDSRPDAQEMTVDLKLRSGLEVTARVRTSDGQPLGAYYVLGAADEHSWMEQNEDRFTIVGCYPDETRRLFLYQPVRNLVASMDVTGVPPEPLEIRLRPGASVTGRLLDENGDPVKNAYLISERMPLRATVGHLAGMKRDVGRVPIAGWLPRTDAKGRFEIKGLVPGLKYSAQLMLSRRRDNMSGPRLVPIFTDMRLKSRETKDVGDVRAKPPEPRRPAIRRKVEP